MKQPVLVILAAGMGSRYGGIKQIEPVGPSGELIIDYSIFDALRAGFGKIIFVIKRSIGEHFLEIVSSRIEKQCEIAHVYQELDLLPAGFRVPDGRSKPWGTGHATLTCQEHIDRPFAVINADDLYGATSFQAISKHLSTAKDTIHGADYSMIGYSLRNTITETGHVSRGVCSVDSNGYLSEIRERTRVQTFGEAIKYSCDGGGTWIDLPPESTVSMNMWGFTPSIFTELERSFHQFLEGSDDLSTGEFYLPKVINDLVNTRRARVKVIPTRERWAGVTYYTDKPKVEKHIANLIQLGEYPESLWE